MYKNSAKAAPMLRTEIKHAAAGGLVLLAALVGSLAPLAASSPEQGKRLALTYCAKCHAIDKVSPSPLKIAPPFRTLHERYSVEMLQEALAEGIVTGHPTMPQFSFDADQVGDFLAFLKTLE
ncbi:MAG TPA: c-type cytochrome [Bradyrhizobium sp.]|jgi:cytochrome c553|nr:c-type cytochrome [Bradyrhizobium sp.]